MRQKLRSRLTFANVASAIALFVAVATGGAYAANTIRSIDIVDGEVKTPDLATGAVTSPKLGPNSVASGKVLNNSLTGADLAPSALPRGRSIFTACNPETTNFVDCGTLTINLTRFSRVLIVATAMWHSGANPCPACPPGPASRGTCRIGVNGAPFGPSVFPGEPTNNSSSHEEHSLTLTYVTPPNLGPGEHTLGLTCNETDGDIDFDETFVSAVVLSPA